MSEVHTEDEEGLEQEDPHLFRRRHQRRLRRVNTEEASTLKVPRGLRPLLNDITREVTRESSTLNMSTKQLNFN